MEAESAHCGNKRVRDDTTDDVSSDTKRFKEAEVILEMLDEDDFNPSVDQLENVMKSLEEEIVTPTRLDYEYLLEASDDELGIPPAVNTEPSTPVTDGGDFVEMEKEGFDRIWGFEDDVTAFLGTGFSDGVCFDGLEFSPLVAGQLDGYD